SLRSTATFLGFCPRARFPAAYSGCKRDPVFPHAAVANGLAQSSAAKHAKSALSESTADRVSTPQPSIDSTYFLLAEFNNCEYHTRALNEKVAIPTRHHTFVRDANEDAGRLGCCKGRNRGYRKMAKFKVSAIPVSFDGRRKEYRYVQI